jgi:hypothetical protein
MLTEIDAWCMEHGMHASPGRLGGWLERHFGELIAAHRGACARGTRAARGLKLRRTPAPAAPTTPSKPPEADTTCPEAGVRRSGAVRSGTRRIRRHTLTPEPRRRSLDQLARVAAITFLVAFTLLCAL